jgi:hypothetical protein
MAAAAAADRASPFLGSVSPPGAAARIATSGAAVANAIGGVLIDSGGEEGWLARAASILRL